VRKRASVPVAVAVLALALGPPASAQLQPGSPRIGFLGLGRSGPSLVGEAFRQGLRDLGYIEGRTIAIESRLAEGAADRLPGLARELIALRVSVIVAAGGPAIRAARDATATIPIVMVNATDPVGSGFVASLARPGGNVTGVSNISAELGGKRLQLLQALVPRLARVAVLRDPGSAEQVVAIRGLEGAARSLGLELLVLDVHGPEEIPGALQTALRQRAGALVAMGDGFTFTNRGRIIDAVTRLGLPAIYPSREFVDAGGLVSYGVNLPDQFRRCASYVARILRGARPGDLPVERPTTFELIVNRRAELSLGLTVPDAVLLQADQIIE
jgi:putative ABC transport system substrate-binding protein